MWQRKKWKILFSPWLLIWWPLEIYMVVNFRACGISRGTRKLTWTPTLNLKKKKKRTWCSCLCFSLEISMVIKLMRPLNWCWWISQKSKIESSGQERNLCDFACFFFGQKSRNIKWPREKFMVICCLCTQVVFS
jgi:hypothetical protein